jgi:hypothetical protein
MTTSVTSPADNLRAALKKAGFTARQVSVRYPHSTLHVTIRDAHVSLSRIEQIAGQFESVSRDHATGEILSGGNTFVQVAYADALVEPIKAEIIAVLGPAPSDEYVALPHGYRAMKVSREHGATYYGQVTIQGPGFDWKNNLAVEVGWAVATGDGGYQFHRDHRDPGTRPVAPERSFALAIIQGGACRLARCNRAGGAAESAGATLLRS